MLQSHLPHITVASYTSKMYLKRYMGTCLSIHIKICRGSTSSARQETPKISVTWPRHECYDWVPGHMRNHHGALAVFKDVYLTPGTIGYQTQLGESHLGLGCLGSGLHGTGA